MALHVGLFIFPEAGGEGHQIDHPRATTGNRNGNQAHWLSPVLSLRLASTWLHSSGLAWCQGPACIVPRGQARPALWFVPAGLCDGCKVPAAACGQLTHGQREGPGESVLSCLYPPRWACPSLEPLS